MQALESIPVFRTQKPLAPAEVAKEVPGPSPVAPMWRKTNKPALPPELWLDGLPLAEALAAHRRLKADYFCTCGKGDAGYYVRADLSNYRLMP